MSLFQKAESNKTAAELLKNNGLDCSSVHCSYYSIVQILKHLLLNVYNETEQSISDEQNNRGWGTHRYLIWFFSEELRTLSYVNARTFRSEINQLKELRVNSDYKDLVTSNIESQNAVTLSSSLMTIIRRTYHI